jgi:hypothetical protein
MSFPVHITKCVSFVLSSLPCVYDIARPADPVRVAMSADESALCIFLKVMHGDVIGLPGMA